MLNGRRVVVTGAAGALGRAVISAVSREGGEPVGLDLAPGPHIACVLDLADPSAASAAFARIGAHDALICLAGGFEMARQDDPAADAVWNRMLRVNFETFRNSVLAARPHLAADGAIVAVGANVALKGVAGLGAYCAAKSAVMRLVETLAAENELRGPRVNAVLPDIIDTSRNRAEMPNANSEAWTAPGAIADLICFLASPRARAVSGVLVPATYSTRKRFQSAA